MALSYQESTVDPSNLKLSDYYTPHSGQARLHAVNKKVKTLEVGRRWGKSRFALWEMFGHYVRALTVPVPSSLIPPWHCWVVVPTLSTEANQIWNELLAFIPVQFIQNISEEEKQITLRGTEARPWGLIELKSAYNHDHLQTVGLDVLWVNEAQDVSDKAFEKLLPTTVSPGRTGYVIYEGIPPMWSSHWFHKVFNAGIPDPVTGLREIESYESFHATAFDNPLLDEDALAEIEGHRSILTERAWRRMYLAEFSEDAGYFTNISACIAGDILHLPLPGSTYVAGLDLGRKMDPSVLTIMDAADRKVVSHFPWDAGDSWVSQREMVTKFANEWHLSRIVIDATGTGGDMFAEQMAEANLPVEPYIFTSASREYLLSNLAISLERQTVAFPQIPQLVRQLRSFQSRRLPSGQFKAEAPPGEHDDSVFSLALALTACAEPPSLVTRSPLASLPGRYVPTQEEANNGRFPTSRGGMMMAQRRSQRMHEAMERLGVRID